MTGEFPPIFTMKASLTLFIMQPVTICTGFIVHNSIVIFTLLILMSVIFSYYIINMTLSMKVLHFKFLTPNRNLLVLRQWFVYSTLPDQYTSIPLIPMKS